eukprot:1161127-Pelagomonas_calceolata.AAC.8
MRSVQNEQPDVDAQLWKCVKLMMEWFMWLTTFREKLLGQIVLYWESSYLAAGCGHSLLPNST